MAIRSSLFPPGLVGVFAGGASVPVGRCRPTFPRVLPGLRSSHPLGLPAPNRHLLTASLAVTCIARGRLGDLLGLLRCSLHGRPTPGHGRHLRIRQLAATFLRLRGGHLLGTQRRGWKTLPAPFHIRCHRNTCRNNKCGALPNHYRKELHSHLAEASSFTFVPTWYEQSQRGVPAAQYRTDSGIITSTVFMQL